MTSAPRRSIPAYLSCLKKCKKSLVTSDGHKIDLWKLNVPSNASYLSAWATNFRNQYCLDTEIDSFRNGTGLSRADYLLNLVFPDKNTGFGPGIRAGDFAELLVSDYLEHLLGYWVPREKYAEKAIRDESVKGVDIIGFKPTIPAPQSPTDTLLAFEVKAQLSNTIYNERLQKAIEDSSMEYLRRAMTLNATKLRLIRSGKSAKALVVERFQNPLDFPYIYRSGAAAVLSDSAFDEPLIQSTSKVTGHNNRNNLELIVIKGKDLMKLVHSLYERAANEA